MVNEAESAPSRVCAQIKEVGNSQANWQTQNTPQGDTCHAVKMEGRYKQSIPCNWTMAGVAVQKN